MEGTLVFLKIGGGEPVPHHHIRIMVQNPVHHLRCKFHGIGIVPIHHNITLGFYLPEHTPDHISLSLEIFIAQHCPVLPGNFGGAVCRIIIIHINHRFRQRSFGVLYYLGNCLFLIIAGNQNSYFVHRNPSFSSSNRSMVIL